MCLLGPLNGGDHSEALWLEVQHMQHLTDLHKQEEENFSWDLQ